MRITTTLIEQSFLYIELIAWSSNYKRSKYLQNKWKCDNRKIRSLYYYFVADEAWQLKSCLLLYLEGIVQRQQILQGIKKYSWLDTLALKADQLYSKDVLQYN